jgi:subtilisin family serine protease
MKKSSLFAALVLLSACEPVPMEEGALQAPPGVDSAELESSGRYLVAFKSRPGAAERAWLKEMGANIRKDFSELNVAAVEMKPSKMAALMRSNLIDTIEEDALRMPLALSNSQLAPATNNGLYGLLSTQATAVHALGVTGASIKIGVADTGLDYTHPDIAPVYKGGIDTVSNDADPWWNNDVNETHGTHVAGTIVAAHNSVGVYGVAYGAQLYHARVLGPNGGTTSDIMDGVRWLVETAGCKIVNLSLGGGTKSRIEETFYNEMRTKGALIVAATGNDGASKVSFPAGYAANIAVGAVDANNALATFSNRGTNIDVVAPGVMVLSSVPGGTGSEASVSTTATFMGLGFEFAGRTAGLTKAIVNCGLGQAGECPASVSGNIALVQRGTINFSDKVLNAMNQGAVAAILYNNAAGDFSGTLGTATTADGRAWIPAISVSDTTGAALKAQAGTSGTVVNQASAWDLYDGTSMATPHVSGVLGLIWSSKPSLTHTQVEAYLYNTAVNLGAAGYDTTYGYGLVNARAAVKAASGL